MKLIKLLVENNADVNLLTLSYHSAISIALSKKNYGVVQYLLELKQLELLRVSANDTCIYHHLNMGLFNLEGHKIIF